MLLDTISLTSVPISEAIVSYERERMTHYYGLMNFLFNIPFPKGMKLVGDFLAGWLFWYVLVLLVALAVSAVKRVLSRKI